MAAEDAFEAEAMMQHNVADSYLKHLSQVARSKPALVVRVETFNTSVLPKLATEWLGWYDARPLRRAAADLVQHVQPIAAALILTDWHTAHQDSSEESSNTAPAHDTTDTQMSRHATPGLPAHFQQPAVANRAAVRKQASVPVERAADVHPAWILTQPCGPVNGFSHSDLFKKPPAHVSSSPVRPPLQLAPENLTDRLHSRQTGRNWSDPPSTEKHLLGSTCSKHCAQARSGLPMHLSPEGRLMRKAESRPSGSDASDLRVPLSPRALFTSRPHLSRASDGNSAGLPLHTKNISSNSVIESGSDGITSESVTLESHAAAIQTEVATLRHQYRQVAHNASFNSQHAQLMGATSHSWGGANVGHTGSIDWETASKMAADQGPEGASRQICQAALGTIWTSVHQGQTSVSDKLFDIVPLETMDMPPPLDFSAPFAEITQAVTQQAGPVAVKRKRSIAEEDPEESTVKKHKAVFNISAFAGVPPNLMEVDS